MWKIVGTLALMVVSGIVTLAAVIVIPMELGLRRYDNYMYYDVSWALGWGLVVIGFLAPGVVVGVVWYLHKRTTRKGRSQ